jgi:predicted O-methyltransferase YrrM
MIPDPDRYFRNLVPPRSALIRSLEEQAQREDIPIVGPLVGELLYILVRATHAVRVLELGTATGYSALFLAEACAAIKGRLTTLEWDAEMARQAEVNLAAAGLTPWVEIRCTDALEEMTQLEGQYDLIFMDIEKEDYATLLPQCSRITAPGGLLLADNVAFADADPFNRAIHADPGWRSVALYALLPLHSPEKDGLGLAVRI